MSISFLLKSHPAFPGTADGLQGSYLLPKQPAIPKEHRTFPHIYLILSPTLSPDIAVLV